MLPTLQAEQQLRDIEAASAPHMSAKGHRELIAALKRQLAGNETGKRAPATASGLARIGIAVEYVNADGTPAGDGTRPDETGGDP